MRVTHNLMADRLLANLWNTQRRLVQYHNQGSSQKRVNVPSDDPAGAMSILRYRTSLKELDRHGNNAAEALEWQTVSDEAIMHLHENLHRARELALASASSNLPQDARLAYVAEMDEIINQAVALGNTAYDGRYIFGGHQTIGTDDGGGGIYAPFRREGDTVIYNGDDGVIVREVGPGTTIQINVPGEELFGSRSDAGADGQGVFGILFQLRDAMTAADVDLISEDLLGQLAQVHEEVSKQQVKLGAGMRRAEQVQAQKSDMSIATEALLDNVESADLAEVALRLNSAETSYRYALAVGARIIQPSLIEYLR